MAELHAQLCVAAHKALLQLKCQLLPGFQGFRTSGLSAPAPSTHSSIQPISALPWSSYVAFLSLTFLRLQVTDAIKGYVEDKLGRALANYSQVVKEVDVTLSARGGDTGTHGKK